MRGSDPRGLCVFGQTSWRPQKSLSPPCTPCCSAKASPRLELQSGPKSLQSPSATRARSNLTCFDLASVPTQRCTSQSAVSLPCANNSKKLRINLQHTPSCCCFCLLALKRAPKSSVSLQHTQTRRAPLQPEDRPRRATLARTLRNTLHAERSRPCTGQCIQ